MTSPTSILLTGASSGIGLELARRLYLLEYRVVITARKSSLEKLAAEFK
ncbi:MAG: SDR family NAD(P)-dependent oxidoreductase, partial [Proteobacteria bacterium]|nr:SDR family NAD(P)-dependent oxidoreductase [Pseudomonadota bacterium]